MTSPRDERKIRDICTEELTETINAAKVTISARMTRRHLVEMGL